MYSGVLQYQQFRAVINGHFAPLQLTGAFVAINITLCMNMTSMVFFAEDQSHLVGLLRHPDMSRPYTRGAIKSYEVYIPGTWYQYCCRTYGMSVVGKGLTVNC